MSAAVQRRSLAEMDIRRSSAGGDKSGDRPGFNLRGVGGAVVLAAALLSKPLIYFLLFQTHKLIVSRECEKLQ